MNQYYLIALLAGVFYAFAGVLTKQATQQGTSILRIHFTTRWISCILLLPVFLFLKPEVHDWSAIWGAVQAAAIIFVCWMLVLFGIKMGEVSIIMPLLGTKILFVATFSIFMIGGEFPQSWWIGTILTFLGIFILGFPNLLKRNFSYITIACALVTAPFIAVADIIIARDAPKFGEVAFVLAFIVSIAAFSLVLIPFFFKKQAKSSPSFIFRWGIPSALFIALEEISITYALAFSTNPTTTNIVYNSRGIWTILLVWIIGHWFENNEKSAGWKTMTCRLIGSILLCIAIIIILQ